MGLFDRLKKRFSNEDENAHLIARIKELEAREPQVIIKEVIREVEVIKEVPQQVLEPTVIEVEDVQVEVQPVEQEFKSLQSIVSTRSKYQLNDGPYYDFIANHRIHQKQALAQVSQNAIGKVILPTGCGKTRIQVSIHIEDMIAKTKANQTGVYVIAAHRLALCTQLMGGTSYDDLLDLAVRCGLSFDVLFIGAARFNLGRVFDHYANESFNKNTADVTSTTSQSAVYQAYLSAKRNNRHLMVVSTYNSIHKLCLIPEIDIITYDEAHSIVTASVDKNDEDALFYNNITQIKHKVLRNYFFTATPKILRRKGNALEAEIDFDDTNTPESEIITGGMDDVSFFGKTLIIIKPAVMVEKGEIVAPRFHFMENMNGDDEKYSVQSIITAFNTHIEVVKHNSQFPDSIGAKLLITCEGADELESIISIEESPEFREYCKTNNIYVIAVMSRDNTNIYNDNDKYIFEDLGSKDKILEKMDALPDNANAIIFHIRMMTEGIDLPAITGVMPFRHLNISELMQTLGRAARLVKSDRRITYSIPELNDESTYDNYIMSDEYKAERFTKPVCYIIFPSHINEIVMTEALTKIRNEYGIPLEQLNFNSGNKARQTPELPQIKDIDTVVPRVDDVVFNQMVEKIRINDFTEILGTIPKAELRQKLSELFQEGI